MTLEPEQCDTEAVSSVTSPQNASDPSARTPTCPPTSLLPRSHGLNCRIAATTNEVRIHLDRESVSRAKVF